MEESLNLAEKMKKEFGVREVDIRTYSPLALAYIGDAVFDLLIRTVVVERGNRPANSLHKYAIQYVNAGTQSKMIRSLLEELTEEEAAVYRRGKNANFHTKAKNATIDEYRKATGLEALVGYLYLTGRMDRIVELLKIGLHNIDMEL